MYKNLIKPILDTFISLILLVITAPLFIGLIIILCLTNHGSPFFLQLRPGKNGKIFRVIKLKTMNDRRDAEGTLLPDSERLTPIGRMIRKTSLDEIPQLLNVIKGDMSFIGPRPLLVEYLPLYSQEQARRQEVKPGITGWAQVNGRNAITWEEKFAHDLYYVDHLSFPLDLKILLLTIVKAIKREGINQQGHETMEKFRGTKFINDQRPTTND